MYSGNVNAGTATASASFAGDDNHDGSSDSKTFTIAKAAPIVTWSDPADIQQGVALSAAQLNATGNVPGTFTYAPTAGTVLPAGIGQTLSVQFVPADSANYSNASASVRITVTDATPPSITVGTDKTTLWPPSGANTPVVVSGRITDASGIASARYRVVDAYGQAQPTGGVAPRADGTYTFTVMLPAARNGNDKDGRRFDVIVEAVDRAGNRAAASAAVIVPHDQSKK